MTTVERWRQIMVTVNPRATSWPRDIERRCVDLKPAAANEGLLNRARERAMNGR